MDDKKTYSRKTEIIKIKNDRELPPFEVQSRALRTGGIVAFPTETVYGIAVAADREDAIEAVFRLKERDRGKPLTLHISNVSAVDSFVNWESVSERDRQVYLKLIEQFWPGPLSVILPKKRSVPNLLTGGFPTIAFRFPSHPVSLAFIDSCGGAVAGTSANVSGNFSCTTGKAVYEELGGKIDYILEADQGIFGMESTIVSIADGVNVLRHGAIGIPMIASVLGDIKINSDLIRRASGSDACNNLSGNTSSAKEKVRFYLPDEVTRVFELLVTDETVAAVLFIDSVYYNISPVLQDKRIKSRVRIMTKESFISKFYKVLRALNSDQIKKIYLPKMDGAGVESAVCKLLDR